MSFNCKIKTYKDGHKNIIYCNDEIFERAKNKKIIEEEVVINDKREFAYVPTVEDFEEITKHKNKLRYDSLKRAKDKVYDIVLQNEWSFFVTVTFDEKHVNSKNVSEVMRKLTYWLGNLVKRKDLKYLLVPETHKKGGIHCHLLVNDVLTLIDSGRVDYHNKAYTVKYLQSRGIDTEQYKTIYNVHNWRYGWSTAIKVTGNPVQLAHYIVKYITKDSKVLFGKYYWSSRNICRECDVTFDNVSFSDVQLQEFKGFCNRKFKYELVQEYYEIKSQYHIVSAQDDFFDLVGG